VAYCMRLRQHDCRNHLDRNDSRKTALALNDDETFARSALCPPGAQHVCKLSVTRRVAVQLILWESQRRDSATATPLVRRACSRQS
jgi:hypothetical protein